MFIGDLDEENEQSDEDLEGKLIDEDDEDLGAYDKKTTSTANTANKKKGSLIGKKRNNKKINLEYEYENEDLSSNKTNTNKNKDRSQVHNNFDF